MSFVNNDDTRKALSPNRANKTFAIRILPWRPWCYQDFFDSHVLDTLAEELAIDGVTIANQEPRCRVIEKGTDK